ncbi:retrovirus-related pol polyprotein from transposon TNT 1-94 [Tanacetum coccineum]
MPYEMMHDRKPDLKYFHVFGALCYPTNDIEDLEKLKPKVDIGIFIGYSPAKKAYRIYNKWTRMIMKNIHVEFDELTTIASEQFKRLDILFQPMFNEYFQPSPKVVSLVPPVVAPIPDDTTDTPSSTIIDQDAPSTSTSTTIEELQAPLTHQEPSSDESSSRDVRPLNLQQINQPFDHIKKWTKDHPLDIVIGNPS